MTGQTLGRVFSLVLFLCVPEAVNGAVNAHPQGQTAVEGAGLSYG